MLKALMSAVTFGAALASGAALADEAVTPQEVVAKVQEAAAFLAKEGKAGLPVFEADPSPYVWNGTYVFVYDCAADVIVAHPVVASRGVKISSLRDANGKAYGGELCDAAAKPGGSWTEYQWPKPLAGTDGLTYTDEAYRKVSYMLSVDGQTYQVGAGIYNDAMSLDDLDAMVAK